MRYFIDVDLNRCIACGACAVACMDQNDIDTESGGQPFRSCVSVETEKDGNAVIRYMSLSCMHCGDPKCVKACPVGCIKKDEETGFVVCDNTRCIGCHSCAMGCPFGVPTFVNNKMQKCDGCIERVKRGLEPACVRVCPMGAMHLYTEEEYKAAKLSKAVKSLFKASEKVAEEEKAD